MNKTIIIFATVLLTGQNHMRASENPQQWVQLPDQALNIGNRVPHEPTRHPENNPVRPYRHCLKTCLCCIACVGTTLAVPVGFIMVHLSKNTPEELIK